MKPKLHAHKISPLKTETFTNFAEATVANISAMAVAVELGLIPQAELQTVIDALSNYCYAVLPLSYRLRDVTEDIIHDRSAPSEN